MGETGGAGREVRVRESLREREVRGREKKK